MTESKSYLMGSTLTRSFHDLNVPLISFVGRPSDSRKGLQSFLDAIACLLTLEAVPRFSVWIVGGAPEEALVTHDMVMCRAPLRQALATGQVVIWGRVETESLPDIYARSFLVVMPSKLEQFGLVAIEAMACGTPVVATNTGGLADVIVDGYTGILITEHDSSLLANTIGAYLRDPERRHLHGSNAAAWVRYGFDRKHIYNRFIEAYAASEERASPGFPSVVSQRSDLLDRLRPALARLIGETILEVNDCSTSKNLCCEIIAEEGHYFGKWFAVEPTRSPTVLPLPPSLRGPRRSNELITRYRFNSDNPATPRLKAASEAASLIVTEWYERATFPCSADERGAVRRIVSDFRTFAPPRPGPVLSQYQQALDRALREPGPENILSFDEAAARLNSELTGGALRFGHAHPYIELLRYRDMMARQFWALPEGFRIRAAAVVEHALSQRDVSTGIPLFCHGSLQGRHLLFARNRVVACDLDSCRFAVGPMDEAHYTFARLAHKEVGPVAAIKELQDLVPGTSEFQMALAWLVAYLLFEGLYALMQGKADRLDTFTAFSDAYLSHAYLLGDDEAQQSVGEPLAVTPQQVGSIL